MSLADCGLPFVCSRKKAARLFRSAQVEGLASGPAAVKISTYFLSDAGPRETEWIRELSQGDARKEFVEDLSILQNRWVERCRHSLARVVVTIRMTARFVPFLQDRPHVLRKKHLADRSLLAHQSEGCVVSGPNLIPLQYAPAFSKAVRGKSSNVKEMRGAAFAILSGRL